MTDKPTESVEVVVVAQPDDFYSKAAAVMSASDVEQLRAYKDAGRHRLAARVLAEMFELFLNGSTVAEIHKLNPSLPYPAILWGQVDGSWDQERTDYVRSLQLRVKDKVLKAQYETASLMSDMLVAAHKQHGDKLRRYIQTGNDKDLGDAMTIKSIMSLRQVVDGLQKLTGQDRTFTLKSEKSETLNANINVTAGGDTMSPDMAAEILAAVARVKRLQNASKDTVPHKEAAQAAVVQVTVEPAKPEPAGGDPPAAEGGKPADPAVPDDQGWGNVRES